MTRSHTGTRRNLTARLRAAVPAIGLVYAVNTLVALVPTLAIGAALRRLVARLPEGESALAEPGGGLALEIFSELVDTVTHRHLSWGLVALGLFLVVAPALQLTLIHSLTRLASDLGESLRWGLASYGRALLVTLGLLPLFLAAITLLVGAPLALHHGLDAPVDVSVRDRQLALAALPGLFSLAAWSAAHDYARSALVRPSFRPFRDALALSISISARTVGRYLGFAAVAIFVAVIGHAANAWLDGQGMVRGVLVLAVSQVFVFGHVLVRAGWLATCVAEHDLGTDRAPVASVGVSPSTP